MHVWLGLSYKRCRQDGMPANGRYLHRETTAYGLMGALTVHICFGADRDWVRTLRRRRSTPTFYGNYGSIRYLRFVNHVDDEDQDLPE
jgi:hypothetical protein